MIMCDFLGHRAVGEWGQNLSVDRPSEQHDSKVHSDLVSWLPPMSVLVELQGLMGKDKTPFSVPLVKEKEWH